MDCRELKGMMDSYISDELLVETNHGMLRHLENCPACRGELAARRDLRLRFRDTIRQADENRVDPVFATRLSARLRDRALRPNWWDAVGAYGRVLTAGLAVAAVAALFFGFGGFGWVFEPARTSVGDIGQSNPANDRVPTPELEIVRAVKASWKELTSKAVGDHENCALDYKLAEAPITLDDAAKQYGPFNKDLDKVIEKAVKTGFDGSDTVEFLESHSCVFDGRRFAHIVIKQKGKVISVLVTDTDLPLGSDDIMTASAGAKINAAGLRFGHHAVFVVSELPNTENVMLARTIAPAIRLHAEKLGA